MVIQSLNELTNDDPLKSPRRSYCIICNMIYLYITTPILKLPSLFAARHNKLHNMNALVILRHHDHHFSDILVFMKKFNFCPCELFWSIFRRKNSTAHCFNIGAHIRICAQISRNTLLYLPSLKRESPILLLILISAWLTVSRAFNSDEKSLLNYPCLI